MAGLLSKRVLEFFPNQQGEDEGKNKRANGIQNIRTLQGKQIV